MLQQKTTPLEQIIFLCFLAFNVINVWVLDVYITLDGPAHLYNANLLNHIASSAFLQEFYMQNSFFLPNYLSHLLLSKLALLFHPLVSEKILLSFIVIFLPLSFRLLITDFSKSKQGTMFSFLIFPLVFTKLLHTGFYNFTLAFIFFNCQLVLYHRIFYAKKTPLLLILFIANSLILFYSHAFVFGLAMATLAFHLFILFYKKRRDLIKNMFFMFLLCLPAMLLFVLFVVTIHIPGYSTDLKPYEKCLSLITFSPGVVFDIDNELPYTFVFAVLIIILFSNVLSERIINKEKLINSANDFFLMFALGAIYLAYHSTDGILGGMFMHRLFFIIFYLLVFWLCCSLSYSRYVWLFSLIVVIYSYTKLSYARFQVMYKASLEAKSVMLAGNYIPSGSVVYSVNNSDIWFHKHFSNYLGLTKELVLSDNYEAVLGWFPLKWKHDALHTMQLDTLKNKNVIFYPDYVFVYGNAISPDSSVNAGINIFINNNGFKIFESADGFCSLYKVKKDADI